MKRIMTWWRALCAHSYTGPLMMIVIGLVIILSSYPTRDVKIPTPVSMPREIPDRIDYVFGVNVFDDRALIPIEEVDYVPPLEHILASYFVSVGIPLSNTKPTKDDMREHLSYRSQGLQDFVEDNGIDSLSSYGWEREWPPIEGFLTDYDIDRLINENYETYILAMEAKASEALYLYLLTISPHKEELRTLAKMSRSQSRSLWEEIFANDPYPYDVFALAERIGLD